MGKNNYFVLGVVLLFSLGIFGNIALGAELPEGEDPNIIIFSESHGSVSYEQKKEGTLKIGVTTFSPIIQLSINGKAFDVPEKTKATVEMPYTLSGKTTDFKVLVVTEAGRQEKTYVIHLGKKPEPGRSPFQLIGIVGISSLDNVTSASSDAQSGTKLSLTAVPIYTIRLQDKMRLRIRGILLREKFSEKDFSGNEISYTQLFVEWIKRDTAIGDISVGAGINDIRTDNTNPLLGENESLTEDVVSGKMKQKLSRDLSWDLMAEVKMKDSKTEPISANYDADALDIGIGAGVDYKIIGLDLNGDIGYISSDAKGKYEDSSTIKYALKAAYPVDDFIPGVAYNVKQKTRNIANESGVKQKDSASTLTVKLGYKWKTLPNSQFALTWKSKSQTSNVKTSEFSASTTTLSLTYIF